MLIITYYSRRSWELVLGEQGFVCLMHCICSYIWRSLSTFGNSCCSCFRIDWAWTTTLHSTPLCGESGDHDSWGRVLFGNLVKMERGILGNFSRKTPSKVLFILWERLRGIFWNYTKVMHLALLLSTASDVLQCSAVQCSVMQSNAD